MSSEPIQLEDIQTKDAKDRSEKVIREATVERTWLFFSIRAKEGTTFDEQHVQHMYESFCLALGHNAIGVGINLLDQRQALGIVNKKRGRCGLFSREGTDVDMLICKDMFVNGAHAKKACVFDVFKRWSQGGIYSISIMKLELLPKAPEQTSDQSVQPEAEQHLEQLEMTYVATCS